MEENVCFYRGEQPELSHLLTTFKSYLIHKTFLEQLNVTLCYKFPFIKYIPFHFS